jgi:beta-glucosidase-like glycosyl hydrolase
LQGDKVLDGSNYADFDGGNVWIWGWINGTNQKWHYNSTSGMFRYGQDSTKCLDAGTSIVPCSTPASSTKPFCNYTLSVEERVKNLISLLSVSDKVGQLGNSAPPIMSLDIPAYQWWSEALHGLANSPGVRFGDELPYATSFPQVINLGATFDMPLVLAMAKAIATEARAFANQGQAGLTFFAPNINIFRDPRWGRGQETPGEDPYLTSQYVINFARGMQEGEDPRYLKTIITCKHFAVYNLENDTAKHLDRHSFNAVTSDQDLMETYFPAFQACVSEGRAKSIMCSYNAVNGVPSCANGLFQNTAVRDEWGFDGYIVSDCGAISNIMNPHHYTNTSDQTVAAGLKGGCDLDCGSFYPKNGVNAYNDKAIGEEDLDLAMKRLFTARIELGMFDPPEMQPYTKIPPQAVNTKDNQELALQLARESITLLKNDGTLPLKPTMKVAVIGPHYNATTDMQGNYQGTAPFLISPVMGIQAISTGEVLYAPGCYNVWCTDTSGFNQAVTLSKSADVVVMVMGISTRIESEGRDRTFLSLPGHQEDLMNEVKKAANGPIIVVLMSGGPVDMTWAKENANGLLWMGYAGQSGGQGLAEVLYGKFNPSGRLPWTMYPADYVSQVDFTSMSMRDGPGRSYRFYTGNAVYQFGTGMSYTNFTYQWDELLSLKNGRSLTVHDVTTSNGITYKVKVTNTGSMAGGVSVLAMMTSTVPDQPKKTLFGFERVDLQPGESTSLFFAMQPQTLKLVNKQGKKVFMPGEFGVEIGDLKDTFVLSA